MELTKLSRVPFNPLRHCRYCMSSSKEGQMLSFLYVFILFTTAIELHTRGFSNILLCSFNSKPNNDHCASDSSSLLGHGTLNLHYYYIINIIVLTDITTHFSAVHSKFDEAAVSTLRRKLEVQLLHSWCSFTRTVSLFFVAKKHLLFGCL